MIGVSTPNTDGSGTVFSVGNLTIYKHPDNTQLGVAENNDFADGRVSDRMIRAQITDASDLTVLESFDITINNPFNPEP